MQGFEQTKAHTREYTLEEALVIWMVGLRPADVRQVPDEHNVVLTRPFVFKLLMIHERKRKTGIPLVLIGGTGVGT